MKFVKSRSTIAGLKHLDRGMYYIGRDPVRVILGPCMSIICSSAQARVIGLCHIYPTPYDDEQFGPYNHPENVVAAYLKQITQLKISDASFWVVDREKTTIRGKEMIMRSIDAIISANYTPTLLNGFPQRCALTSNPGQMLVEVYDISSHE